jgi:hypothetical protein
LASLVSSLLLLLSLSLLLSSTTGWRFTIAVNPTASSTDWRSLSAVNPITRLGGRLAGRLASRLAGRLAGVKHRPNLRSTINQQGLGDWSCLAGLTGKLMAEDGLAK